MTRLGQLMVSLQIHAQALQDAQLRHEIVQTRLYHAMESGLNTSIGRLVAIEGSTARLQDALQDASHSIAKIASLAWIMKSFWKWGSLAVILALVMLAVSSCDRSFVVYLAVAIGKSPNSLPWLALRFLQVSRSLSSARALCYWKE